MTTKLAKWASEHDQIIKSRLSYGHQAKSLPSEAGFVYDWLRFNGYLGNVGLMSAFGGKADITWRLCTLISNPD